MQLIQDILKKQVCNQELAERLYELGDRTPSLFYWSQVELGEWEIKFAGYTTEINGESVSYYHAYTTAELGEMLPSYLTKYDLVIGKLLKSVSGEWEWEISYDECLLGVEIIDVLHRVCSKSEADARAEMRIYLLENKLITL